MVAESDQQIVGTVIAGWDGWRGSIYRLVVAPSHRRAGLGRRLRPGHGRPAVGRGGDEAAGHRRGDERTGHRILGQPAAGSSRPSASVSSRAESDAIKVAFDIRVSVTSVAGRSTGAPGTGARCFSRSGPR